MFLCAKILLIVSHSPSVTISHRQGVQYHPQPTGFAAFGSFEVWVARGGKFAVSKCPSPSILWVWMWISTSSPLSATLIYADKWSTSNSNQSNWPCLINFRYNRGGEVRSFCKNYMSLYLINSTISPSLPLWLWFLQIQLETSPPVSRNDLIWRMHNAEFFLFDSFANQKQ
jgi:hypothetical protein